MPLKIYNTLSKQKENFLPLEKGKAKIYVCGPTVYSHAHIGHAKSYISFDVVVRFLRHLNFDVTYVQNITDVGHLVGDSDEGEDKLEKQSKFEKKHPMAIAEFYTKSFFDDMDALNVLRADISPRATGHIPEQIELVEKLIKNKNAYEVNGSVYFDVSSFKDYGKLSNRSTDDAVSGTRVSSRSEKKNPNDFALWKKADASHILKWQSPWGIGFPGWHLECSAMSMKYLGESFDIHGGGNENQFPHHECEIAQSESVTNKPFVKYWMHNNMVTVDGKKMGKSLGNFTTLKDAFKKFDPVVIRFFILQSHYRSPLDFSEEALEASKKGLQKLQSTIKKVEQKILVSENGKQNFDETEFVKNFNEAMNDDFNTPQAIAVLFDVVKNVNEGFIAGFSNESLHKISTLFKKFADEILGIYPINKAESSDESKEKELIEILIALRNEARTSKNFALSDLVRNKLQSINIVIEDAPNGATWKKLE